MDRFFFCFGPPKSGTTFLQRILNMHPDVSCPSEQNLKYVRKNIEAFFSKYNELLSVIDRRTGGQGAPAVSNGGAGAIFRDTVLNLSRQFAGKKPIHGLNDNAVLDDLALYDGLFGSPKMICIFRNPVDRSLSNWRHNHRLAREEVNAAQVHLKCLANPEGTLEGFVKLQAKSFSRQVEAFSSYTAGRSNFLTVLYEELVEDTEQQVRRLFSFLDADLPEDLLDEIVQRSKRRRMAAESANPEFFGLDARERSTVAVSAEVRSDALASCSRALERLGYDVSALQSVPVAGESDRD